MLCLNQNFDFEAFKNDSKRIQKKDRYYFLWFINTYLKIDLYL